MRGVGREKLGVFCRKHAEARKWIEHWLAEVETAAWTRPQDIRSRYAAASFPSGGVVIFNVRGNDYRLEVTVAYRSATVVIQWAGTHREHDERNRTR